MAPGWFWVWLAAATATGGCSDPDSRFGGIWKSSCANYWGVQISPAGGGLYAVTFCGLSGCLPRSEWMPDTRIDGDSRYQVVSSGQLRIQHGSRDHFLYTRCSVEPRWNTAPGPE